MSIRRRSVVFALPLLACGLYVPPVPAHAGIVRHRRALMGTQVDITLQGSDNAALAQAAAAAFSEMARLADMMSRYHPTSALNAINRMAGIQPVAVPAELLQVLRMARAMAHTSNGAFDPTIGGFSGWNFSAEHPAIPSAAQLAAQRALIDPASLHINTLQSTAYLAKQGMRLDLGGIAKLPILQAGLHTLQAHGVANAMINGGGDVLVMGQLNDRPWRIGLRDPLQPEKLRGMVALSQGFVAASGDYERFIMHQGRRLHHILDPQTGYPSQGLRAVTLISDQLSAINGLGAAIMVAGVQAGQSMLAQQASVDALLVDAKGREWITAGMARKLTTSRFG